MQQSSSATIQIELEIQHLLIKLQEPELVAEELILNYENHKLNYDQSMALANFFLYNGLILPFCQFIFRKMNSPHFIIPWAHLIESLHICSAQMDEEFLNSLKAGVLEQRQEEELSLSKSFDYFMPDLKVHREHRLKNLFVQLEKRKSEMISQLEMLRSQNLLQAEENMLNRIEALVPQEPMLFEARQQLKDRRAQEILSKSKQKSKNNKLSFNYEIIDSESETLLKSIEESVIKLCVQNPQMLYDFAMLHLFLEHYLAGARLIPAETTNAKLCWLRVDLLLMGRQFVDLLEQLRLAEITFIDDPETTFSVLYYRARALWGLEQKFNAVELLEALINHTPEYRMANTLLNEWKDDLS